MKKTITLTLEVDSNDTLEDIKSDLMQEISCASNTYNIVSIQETSNELK